MAVRQSMRNGIGILCRIYSNPGLQKCRWHSSMMHSETHPAPKSSPNWQLCAAVCLTRLPLVAPNHLEIEKEYFELLRQQEYERSVLSQWEIEHNRQVELVSAVETGEKDPQDIDFKVSHQDIEDENEAKLKEFLESEHEHFVFDDDLKNINRKMRDMLVYIVKMKLGNDEVWLLPTQQIQEYETMKECAERALAIHQSDEFQARIFSNAPSSFYKYKFPKGVRLNCERDGAKLFIYSAIAKCSVEALAEKRFGKPTELKFEDPCVLDYAWVTSDELKQRLKPKYFEAVKSILC